MPKFISSIVISNEKLMLMGHLTSKKECIGFVNVYIKVFASLVLLDALHILLYIIGMEISEMFKLLYFLSHN